MENSDKFPRPNTFGIHVNGEQSGVPQNFPPTNPPYQQQQMVMASGAMMPPPPIEPVPQPSFELDNQFIQRLLGLSEPIKCRGNELSHQDPRLSVQQYALPRHVNTYVNTSYHQHQQPVSTVNTMTLHRLAQLLEAHAKAVNSANAKGIAVQAEAPSAVNVEPMKYEPEEPTVNWTDESNSLVKAVAKDEDRGANETRRHQINDSSSNNDDNLQREQTHESSTPTKVLAVYGLNQSLIREALKTRFSKFGQLENVLLVKRDMHGLSHNHCFVFYKHLENAILARTNLDNILYGGRKITAVFSHKPNNHDLAHVPASILERDASRNEFDVITERYADSDMQTPSTQTPSMPSSFGRHNAPSWTPMFMDRANPRYDTPATSPPSRYTEPRSEISRDRELKPRYYRRLSMSPPISRDRSNSRDRSPSPKSSWYNSPSREPIRGRSRSRTRSPSPPRRSERARKWSDSHDHRSPSYDRYRERVYDERDRDSWRDSRDREREVWPRRPLSPPIRSRDHDYERKYDELEHHRTRSRSPSLRSRRSHDYEREEGETDSQRTRSRSPTPRGPPRSRSRERDMVMVKKHRSSRRL